MAIMQRIIFAAILVISSCAAHADTGSLALTDEGDRRGVHQHCAVASINIMLKDDLYEIQPETSKMAFRVDSPIGDVWGSFQDFEGVVAMLGNSQQGDMATIEIDADSLDTDGGFIGLLLKGKRFFDVDTFPSMHFVGESLEWYSEKRAVLKGELTIKGITRQVAFYVELVDTKLDKEFSERITVEASTTVRRSEFGIRSMLPAVSDNVNLFMSIDAVKKPATVSLR